MGNIKLYTLITLLSSLFFSGAAIARGSGDSIPPSTLSKSKIMNYIEHEKSVLRGKFKADIVKKFKEQSNVTDHRFGNNKQILNLKGISFSGEDLSGVIFTLANMGSASFVGTDFSNADLVHVDFTGSDLRGANFTGSDLSNAIFDNANINDAIFIQTNLFNAKLEKVAIEDKEKHNNLLKRTRSYYINLDREELPEYLVNE